MRRIAEFAIARRRLVLVLWLVVFIAGVAGVGKVGGRLSQSFALPGQPGQVVTDALQKTYGNGGDTPSIAVVTVPSGQTVTASKDALASFEAALPSAIEDAVKALPKNPAGPPVKTGPWRVVGYGDTGDPKFLTQDGRSTFVLIFGPTPNFTAPTIKPTEDAVKKVIATSLPSSTVLMTGYTELAVGSTGDSGTGPGLLLEVLVGAGGALLVLAFVFGSFLALIPLVVAAVSVLTSFLLILGLTAFTDVSAIVQFLVGLIGLGVAIDYSLLIVTRLKEERAKGVEPEEAMKRSMEFAGHAVVFSGVTVAIGLAALVALPVPFLRSVGFGGMLIPLVSTVVCITLLPALLSCHLFGKTVADRLDWPHLRKEGKPSPAWTRWAQLVVKNRWASAVAALVLLGVMLVPALSIEIGQSGSSSLSTSGQAFDGLKVLTDGGVGDGVLTPIEVLGSADSATAAAQKASTVEGVQLAVAPTGVNWAKDGTAITIALPTNETVTASSTQVVKDVRSTLKSVPGVQGEAGAGATQIDFGHAVYGNAPLVLLIIGVVTFFLLVRAFRSVLLPLKAVLLNLVSVGATFGALTFFWQSGNGSSALFGISATGAITFWLPMMIFAFLFGLSMDYEVFILSRMREEYDKSGSTDGAVVEGIGRTGRLVTSAALILFLSFTSLASSPGTDLKVFATGLGFGILLDATVVRALLVPSLVSLFGSYNWYMPDALAKLLRVKPSHALHLPSPAVEPAT